MKGVKNYLRNVTKSTIYFAADITANDMENVTEFAKTNSEVIKSAYNAIRHPTTAVQKAVDAFSSSKVYEAIDYGAKNLFEDLRTGNFYNKERIDKDTGKMSGLSADDYNDLSEFGIDDNWEDNLGKESDVEITAGEKKIADTIEGTNQALASTTANAVIASANASIQNERRSTGLLYNQNKEIFNAMHSNFNVLNSTMSAMLNMQTETFKNIDSNLSDYFTQTLKIHTENNQILKQMLDLQTKTAQQIQDEEAAKKKTRGHRYSDVITGDGMIDIEEYIENVKDNINRKLKESGMPEFSEDGNMLATFMMSPMEYIVKPMVESVIPNIVKEAAQDLDKSIAGIFGNVMAMLANNASNSPIIEKVNSILGIRSSVNSAIDTGRYSKGPVPFDGITRKAIVEVIPAYLRRIESAVSGRPETMFDYDTGRWTNPKQVKEDYKSIRTSAIRQGTSDLREAMNSTIKAQRQGLGALGVDKQKEFDEAIDQFFQFLYQNNGRFNPAKSASDNGINGSMTMLNKYYDIIRTMYSNFDVDSKGRHTNISSRVGLSNKILSAKDNENKIYRNYEKSLNKFTQFFSNGGVYDEIGKWKVDNDGKSDKWEANKSLLMNAIDDKGNNIFNYLQHITKELIWQRGFMQNINLFSTGGGSLSTIDLNDSPPPSGGGNGGGGNHRRNRNKLNQIKIKTYKESIDELLASGKIQPNGNGGYVSEDGRIVISKKEFDNITRGLSKEEKLNLYKTYYIIDDHTKEINRLKRERNKFIQSNAIRSAKRYKDKKAAKDIEKSNPIPSIDSISIGNMNKKSVGTNDITKDKSVTEAAVKSILKGQTIDYEAFFNLDEEEDSDEYKKALENLGNIIRRQSAADKEKLRKAAADKNVITRFVNFIENPDTDKTKKDIDAANGDLEDLNDIVKEIEEKESEKEKDDDYDDDKEEGFLASVTKQAKKARDFFAGIVQTPGEMFADLLYSADRAIYNMMFKNNIKGDDEDGEEYDGFMDMISKKTSNLFKGLSESIKTKFIEPLKEKLNLGDRDLYEETKDAVKKLGTNIMGKIIESNKEVYKPAADYLYEKFGIEKKIQDHREKAYASDSNYKLKFKSGSKSLSRNELREKLDKYKGKKFEIARDLNDKHQDDYQERQNARRTTARDVFNVLNNGSDTQIGTQAYTLGLINASDEELEAILTGNKVYLVDGKRYKHQFYTKEELDKLKEHFTSDDGTLDKEAFLTAVRKRFLRHFQDEKYDVNSKTIRDINRARANKKTTERRNVLSNLYSLNDDDIIEQAKNLGLVMDDNKTMFSILLGQEEYGVNGNKEKHAYYTPEELDKLKEKFTNKSGLQRDAFLRAISKRFLRDYNANHAEGTLTSIPFKGNTMLSKGELLFNSKGVGLVKKTDAYNLDEPTHILSSYDSNPILKSMGMNPGARKTPEEDLKTENKVKAKLFGKDGKIAQHFKGTTNDDGKADKVKSTVKSDYGIDFETIKEQAKTNLPEGIAGGIAGGIISTLFGLVGGPLVGAAVGAAGNIVANSDTLKDKLFGKMGKDGSREGGFISKSILDTLNKYAPDTLKYGLAGIIPGLLTPLGPLGGIMVGGAIGFLKNNEAFTNKYFGEEGKLTFDTKTKKLIQDMLPGAAKGAAVGTVAGFLFGGPFGFLGNAAIGAGVGMVASTEEFKEALLGREVNGVRVGGVVGALKDCFEPLKNAGKTIGDKLIEAIDNGIVDPISRFITPFIHEIPHLLMGVPRFISDHFVSKLFSDNNPVGRFIGKNARRLINIGTGIATTTIGALDKINPIRALGVVGDKIKRRQIRDGRADYMTAEERATFMGDKATEFDKQLAAIGNGGMKVDEAEKLMNDMLRIRDSAKSLQRSRKQQQSKTTKMIDDYASSTGARLSPKSRDKLVAALKTGNVDEFVKVLDRAKTEDGHKLSNADKDDFLNGEGGIFQEINKIKELENRERQVGNFGGRTKSEYFNEVIKGQLREKFGDDVVSKIHNYRDLDKIINNLDTEITNRKANNVKEIKSPEQEELEKQTDVLTNIADTLELFVNPERALANAKRRNREIEEGTLINRHGLSEDDIINYMERSEDKEYGASLRMATLDRYRRNTNFKAARRELGYDELRNLYKTDRNAYEDVINGTNPALSRHTTRARYRMMEQLYRVGLMDAPALGSRISQGVENEFSNLAEDANYIGREGMRSASRGIRNLGRSVGDTVTSARMNTSNAISTINRIGSKYKNANDVSEAANSNLNNQIARKFATKYKFDRGTVDAINNLSKTKSKKLSKILNNASVDYVLRKYGECDPITKEDIELATRGSNSDIIIARADMFAKELTRAGANKAARQIACSKIRSLTDLFGLTTSKMSSIISQTMNTVQNASEQQTTGNNEQPIEENTDETPTNHGLGTFLAGKALSGLKTGFNVLGNVAKGAASKVTSLFRNKRNNNQIDPIEPPIDNKDQNGLSAGSPASNVVAGGTVFTQDMEPVKTKKDEDGTVVPDTTDSDTRNTINKITARQKMREKLEELQLKASDKFNQLFNNDDDSKKHGGWLGNALLLLMAAKSGILKTLFEKIAKPLWENIVVPLWDDKIKPFIFDKAVPWLEDTALPAVTNAIADTVTKTVGFLTDNLPNIISTVLLGVTKSAAEITAQLPELFAGAIKKIPVIEKLINKFLDDESKDEKTTKDKLNDDIVFYDKNGNKVNKDNIKPGETYTNKDGDKVTTDEDGNVNVEARNRHTYVKKMAAAAPRVLLKSIAGKKNSTVTAMNKGFSNLAKRKNLLVKATGYLGKTVTAPLTAINNLGSKMRDKALGTEAEGFNNRIQELIRSGAVTNDPANGLVDDTGKRVISKSEFAKQMKGKSEQEVQRMMSGYKVIDDKTGEVVTDAKAARGKGIRNKLADIKSKMTKTKDNVKSKVQDVRNSINKGLNKILGKSDKEAVKNSTKKAASKATSKSGNKGIANVLSRLKQFIDSLLENSTVMKKLTKLANKLHVKSVAKWIKKIGKAIFKNISKFVEKASSKFGLKKVTQTIATKFPLIAAGLAIKDFLVGCDQAESILEVQETDLMEEIVAGLVKAICGYTGILEVYPGTGTIAQTIYKIFGDDLEERQEEAKKEVQEYKDRTGSTDTVEEYMKRNKSFTGKIKEKVSNAWSTVKEKVGDTVTKIKNKITGGDKKKSGSGKYGTGKFGMAKQIDPSIANIRFNAPGDTQYQTIGDSGCGPAAAVTAIQNAYGKGNSNPTVNAAMYALNKGYKEKDGGTKPGFFKDYFNKNGLESSTSTNRSKMEADIKSGKPTVLMGQDKGGVNSNNPYGKNPHYVTATGTDGRGNVIIQDPESKYNNQLYRMKDVLNKSSIAVSARKRYGMSKYGTGSTAAQVWGFLKDKGCTDEAAAGIMGNLRQESGMNPKAIQNNGKGPAAGICQWENYSTKSGRWANLNKYAQSKGKEWTDLQCQMEFMWKEFTKECGAFFGNISYFSNYKELIKTTDYKKACEGFEKVFERAGIPAMENRYKYAKEYLKQFAGKDGESFSGDSSDSSSSTDGDTTTDSSNENEQTSFTDLLGKALENTTAYKAFNLFSGALSGDSSDSSDSSSDSSDSDSDNGEAGGSAKAVIKAAAKEIGYKESPGNHTKYGKWYGADGNPWCAYFVSYVADKAGVPTSVIPKQGYTVAAYKDILNNKGGKKVDAKDSREGDVAYFTHGGVEGIYHTGYVEDTSNNEVHTIEGNSSDQVARRTYPVNSPKLLILRPNYKDDDASSTSDDEEETTDTDTTGKKKKSKKKDKTKTTKWADVNDTNHSAFGGNENKPISKYGMFKQAIMSNTEEDEEETNKPTIKAADKVKVKPTRIPNRDKNGTVTVEPTTPQQAYGTGKNNELLETIVDILMNIADNTDKLNTIVQILNDKLGIDLSKELNNKDNVTKNTKKKRLRKSLAAQTQANTKIDPSSISFIVNNMNKLASE